MTELGRTGPTINTYWVAHGTTLLRVINEYLRPDLNHHDETEPTQRAKQALDQIRDCSTTLYTDLTKTNKRKRAEMVAEDEDDIMEPMADAITDTPAPAESNHHWDVDENGLTWTRVHVRRRQTLYVPTIDKYAP